MTERIGIFIDGPNLYAGAKSLTGDGRIDIPALVAFIAGDRIVTEASFWTGQLDQSVNPTAYAGQRRLFAHIESSIPNARIGRAHLRKRGNSWVEKGVDVGVALDLALGAFLDRWDVGVAVSGDGDLARAGYFVREAGKEFEVVCCGARSLSKLLAEQANRVRTLNRDVLENLRNSP